MLNSENGNLVVIDGIIFKWGIPVVCVCVCFKILKHPTGMPHLKSINASQGCIQKYEDLKKKVMQLQC
jgi:hypothetical protein